MAEGKPKLPAPRGGARQGAGRKPDQWQAMFNKAAADAVTPDRMKALVESLLSDATTGNTKAAGILLDRLLGKVPQSLQHEGGGGGPLEIIVKYADGTG